MTMVTKKNLGKTGLCHFACQGPLAVYTEILQGNIHPDFRSETGEPNNHIIGGVTEYPDMKDQWILKSFKKYYPSFK